MKSTKSINFLDKVFKDKHGKLVIAQSPNVLMWVWIFLLINSFFIHSQPFKLLQEAVLFAWAYLEVYQGVNYFRKVLGTVVLIGLIISFFR